MKRLKPKSNLDTVIGKVNEIVDRLSKRNSKFVPPSPQEVEAYVQIDGKAFCDFYESKGWMIGKNKMKNWRSATRTWLRREQKTKKAKLFPISGKFCGKKGCGLPAVYKQIGAYDNYFCTDHMPEKVKERY